MNCEDVPMSEWDKLTGAEQEALVISFHGKVIATDISRGWLIKPLIDGEGRPLA